MYDQGFETTSVSMQRMVILAFQAPVDDVDRIMGEVVRIVPLAMGKYDSNAYQSAAGIERYRPLEGAAAGPETEVRLRPGIVEVSFELPDDESIIKQVVEAIFQTHSYQEPVGLDDSKNPNRWWNTTGDWKNPAAVNPG
jgi:hypothetical protein